MTMVERLERLGEIWIVDEMDCFGFDFTDEEERRSRSTAQDMGVVLERRSNLRFVYS